jgi:hypothetical protein
MQKGRFLIALINYRWVNTLKINKIILLIQWLESHSSKVHVLVQIRKRIKNKKQTKNKKIGF